MNLKILPRKLLLVDGIGALLSAFLLSVVLIRFQSAVGMPPSVLRFLATWPVFFAGVDLIGYFRKKPEPRIFLRIIAICNLAYCGISSALLYHHAAELTALGWTYFVLELLIVLLLALMEWRVASQYSNPPE